MINTISNTTRLATPLDHADKTLRRTSRIFFLLKSLGLICAICFAPPLFAQPRYQITRIPTTQDGNSVALGINNRGEVVGYSFKGDEYQAFRYSSSDTTLTDVGSLGGKINAACAINDTGQIVGYSQDGNGNLLAFISSRNQPIASLGTIDGASTSEAFGINSSGAAVGDSQSGSQNHRPVLFSKNSVQDLGLGGSNEPDALETAYAINDAGQIVGRHSAGNNAFHAFVDVNGNTTDITTLGGTNGEAFAINKNGLVVGDSDTAAGPAHGFVFDHTQVKDLGTLPGFENASYARGINNAGDIVGESDSADQKSAFLYTNGQLVELDKLARNLSQSGFNSLDVAYAINDNGWIVGYGTTIDNLTTAFVAVPESHGLREQAAAAPQAESQAQAADANDTNYDVFYTKLSSDEGNWVQAGNYGYCFRPRVSADWRPYRDGHWVWSDRGWFWDSNERFGWATYHYGRWANIDGTGWCWIPGNQWAPAWVSWRQSDQNVGWAPLPPEAEYSEQRPISSWSDSYYDIGPAAYVFISYTHWHEPSYANYIEPPGRNVQIISETKNVTNIVTNNNVINNFGPPVQTVITKTNQNIQPVKIALTPTTGHQTNYGQTLNGNQLNVVAPPAALHAQATHLPAVQTRVANPQVDKGWQGVNSQDAEKLKRTIAEQNPPPKNLPSPTPFVSQQTGIQRQVTGTPGASVSPQTTSSPAAIAGQKAPSNLLKPGVRPPNKNATSGASPSPGGAEKKSVPANLIGAKPTVTPGGSPTGSGEKPATAASSAQKQPPGGNAPGTSPSVPRETPPNLNPPRPSATPVHLGSQQNQPIGSPTAKPTASLPPGLNAPHASATPTLAKTPSEERKPATAPTPTPRGEPATPPPRPTSTPQSKQEAPTPTPRREPATAGTPKPAEERRAPQETSTPKPTPASPPKHEPEVAPKQTPEVKATPPPKQIKTPAPEVQHTPVPDSPVRRIPTTESQAEKPAPVQQPAGGQKRETEKQDERAKGRETERGKPTPTP
jgi:probable HAF family extracellular repeat protein